MKKNFFFFIMGAIFAFIILASALNVKAYIGEDREEDKTYKTDRTLIKEVLANQQQTHALLKEIKAAIASSNR